MTGSLSAPNFTALQQRRLKPRDFIWFVVRDRSTGNPVTDGYWSDIGFIDAQVIDPDSGSTVTRTFGGARGLISISDIPRVSNLTVQKVTIKLAQAADRVNDLVRTYDCKQGAVQIFRGLFDIDTNVMWAPAFPRFVGTIDNAPVTTPPAGESGDVTLTCTGHTVELTRSNPDTRDGASQRLRNPIDSFYDDTPTVSEWQQYWGKQSGPIDVVAVASSAGLFNR